MNIPQAILEYLKQNSTAVVEGFGTFSLANSRAVVNSESGVILPPAKQIVFSDDYTVADEGFIGFLTENQSDLALNARQALTVQTEFWKKKIQAGEPFETSPLGAFKMVGEQLQFEGGRISSESPDFYGLEEIKLSDIEKRTDVLPTSDSDYRMNKSILYTFLLALPMLGILSAVIWKREVLFGKKSFDNLSVKTSTHRIEKDSLKLVRAKADSIKADSVHQDSLKNKTIPMAKKWSGNKYKTTKWKQKKRRNHSR